MDKQTPEERLRAFTVERERHDLIELIDNCIAWTREEGFTERQRYNWRTIASRVDLLRAALVREIGADPADAFRER